MSDRITRVYEALGHTASSFAKKLGVSYVTVKGWENGSSQMTMNTIKVLHEQYGLSYEYLMGTGRVTGNEKIDRIINLLEEVDQLRKEINK